MTEEIPLQTAQESAIISIAQVETQAITPEIADRLARHYLALAQLYRSIAGTQPVPTNAHQKRMKQANR